MKDNPYTVQIAGSRGAKMLKSTSCDTGMTVKGAGVEQLRNTGFKGGKDDLSHSIKGAKVGDPD